VWNDGKNEIYDEAVDELTPDALRIENLPERPTRVLSIEMECTLGGDQLAARLYNERLTPYDAVMRYHHAVPRDVFCHVERDSSLGRNGGELIFHRMRMDDPEELDKLHKAISVVRKMIKEGELGMDTRCGLHMHVDAHQCGVGHVRNLVLIFNYLEDVLYRMGGASYPVGHRGMQYAAKLQKQGMKDKQEFGAYFFGANGHGHVLHVGNYWQTMRDRCVCGAANVGMHEKCGCNLGKCTFEFRVWNGSANFRKIRAYAAICQSLVAFARNMPDLDEAMFKPLEFKDNRPIMDANKQAIVERLVWMFKKLAFTDAEREDIMYVIENSTLESLGADNLAVVRRAQQDMLTPAELVKPVYFGARKNPDVAPNNNNDPFIRFEEPDYPQDLDYEDDEEF
jgi:hypothetical protein